MFTCIMGREGHCKQISVVCVESACSGWTTLGLTQLKVVCASWVFTAQAPGCSAGALSKVGLRFMHFPGLSYSGSQVLHKGTDSVGCAFCALPRFEQLRQPGAWRVRCPRWAVRLSHLPGPSRLASQVRHEHHSGVPCVSSGDLISGCDLLGDVNCPRSQEDVVSNWEPSHSLVEGAGLWG